LSAAESDDIVLYRHWLFLVHLSLTYQGDDPELLLAIISHTAEKPFYQKLDMFVQNEKMKRYP
jgi:hypothetical protein